MYTFLRSRESRLIDVSLIKVCDVFSVIFFLCLEDVFRNADVFFASKCEKKSGNCRISVAFPSKSDGCSLYLPFDGTLFSRTRSDMLVSHLHRDWDGGDISRLGVRRLNIRPPMKFTGLDETSGTRLTKSSRDFSCLQTIKALSLLFSIKGSGERRRESIFVESGLIFTSGWYPVDLKLQLFTTVFIVKHNCF